MQGKDTFILYKKYLETISDLSMDQRGELFTLILQYVNDLDPEKSKDPLVAMSFNWIKQDLKYDLEKWKNTCEERKIAGKKGGLKSGQVRSQNKQKEANEPNASKSKQTEAKGSKRKQNEANEADNEYEYEYDNDDIKRYNDINTKSASTYTNFLVKNGFIDKNDMDINLFNDLFISLSTMYKAKNIKCAIKYIVDNTKNKHIKNKYSYFEKAIYKNLDTKYEDSKKPVEERPVTQEDVDELLAEIGDE